MAARAASSLWSACLRTACSIYTRDQILSLHGSAEQPSEIVRRLAAFRASGHHHFWADDVSSCNGDVFSITFGHRQLTDAYLLGLAVAHGGVLATFDRSIPRHAVRGAHPDHLLVIAA